MSQENVEVVRAWVAAINRGAIGELLEIAHPDIEYMSYLANLSGDRGEKVVNAGRLQAKGKASGLQVEEQLAWLHTFSVGIGPGRYLRHEAFSNLGEALAAARVRE